LQVLAILKTKQSELAEVEAKIGALKATLDEKQTEMKVLQDHNDLTAARLNRAGRLTSALADEESRWKESVAALTAELWAIPGDVLVASACVAYLGAFPIHYRKHLSNQWMTECKEANIPSSPQFNLTTVLGDPFQIRTWNMHGLPRDEISIENGIIVTQAGRWPLMIDPEEQANRWIRSMELKNNLKIMKISDPNLLRILEVCIRQGFPLLLEELEETLDPALAPVLGRKVYSHGGRLLIKLGDTVVDYDQNFRLYMTTKLANPHYLPEMCIQITLVNFLVTQSGLEDQLLT
jgi:dynein heavy chain, axonemal